MNAKSDKFQGNIHKRGRVHDDTQVRQVSNPSLSDCYELNRLRLSICLQKSSKSLSVGPVMLGFFLFVVVGSGRT